MNETIKTILERSSPMKFKPEHLPAEDVELIVKAGLKAPSAMNRQTPRFIIVRNEELRNRLSKMNAAVLHADTDPFYGAPDVVVVLGSKNGKPDQDGPIAVQNMLLAAYSLGYGGRWINRCKEMFESEEGKKILADVGIEEEMLGIACVILGYPDEKMTPKSVIDGRVYIVE